MNRSSRLARPRGSRGSRHGSNHPPGTVELLSQERDADLHGKPARVPVSSDDPEDPLRWPMWRKSLNFGLLFAMTMAIFTGLSVQHIFWAQMAKDLNIDFSVLSTADAIQLGSEALGCIVMIPFAKKYGRRSVYIFSTALFTLATWWAAYVKTVPELYLCSILKGFAGAVNEAAVQMSIRDMFFVDQRGTANGVYLVALKLGTSLSPIAAGAQATSSGWRSSYVSLAAALTVITLLFVLAFEETKIVPAPSSTVSSVFDKDGSSSSAATDGPDSWAASPPVKARYPRNMRLQLVTRTDESLWKTLYYPIHIWWLPHILVTSVMFGSGLALIIVMSAMTSIIFPAKPYNFNPRERGLLQLAPLVGSLLGSLYGGYLVDWTVVWLAKRRRGLFEPEMRLFLMPLPALVMSGGLVMFGVTASRGLHWIYPSIGSAMTSFGFSAISDMILTMVIDTYPTMVGEAFVVVAFFRNVVSMAGSLALTPWRKNMKLDSMFVTAAFAILAVNLCALPLAVWGKKIRAATAARYRRFSAPSD